MHARIAAALFAPLLALACAASAPAQAPGAGSAPQRVDRAQRVQPSPYGRTDGAESNEPMMGARGGSGGGGSAAVPRATSASSRWQQDLRRCYAYQDRETCRKEMNAARAAGLYR